MTPRPTSRRLARTVRRALDPPPVEQLLRRLRLRRAARRGAGRPPGSLVTSTGRGRTILGELPAAGSLALRRVGESASRRELLIVRPPSIDAATAASLRELAGNGVPTWVDAHPSPGVPVDGDLWAELVRAPATADPDLERYVRSVRLVRAAAGSPRPTPISVLFATRRPEMLDHALAAIRTQLGVDLQLVVGLHGDQWPAGTEDRIAADWHGDLVTVRADPSTSLGALLDQLARRADAALVTKWDDDDWYGPHHLADLVRAHATSRAQLVGKAAEFVWIEASDETIRRPALGSRTFSHNLAGGTLLLAVADLADVGGFPHVRSSVDRALIERVRASGGTVYRTHGLEYILRRTATGRHTWTVDATYFTAGAVARRPGLDLTFADIPATLGGAPT